jgi:hypothetical protein
LPSAESSLPACSAAPSLAWCSAPRQTLGHLQTLLGFAQKQQATVELGDNGFAGDG